MLFSNSDPVSCPVRIVEPYPLTRTFRVTPDFDGNRIGAVLSTKFPFKDPAYWEDRVERGFIRIGEIQAAAETVVKTGSVVAHFSERVVEPSVPDEVKVLVATDDYLFAYKPAPMPVHPGGRYNKNSLTGILDELGFEDLRLTHRLDAVTSGLIMLARTKRFAAAAIEEFGNGRVQKKYLARVQGIPSAAEATITVPVKRKKGFVFESGDKLSEAREAITIFRLMKTLEDGTSIIECTPVTGRTHQIRLHLKHWGYPIVDDPIYGPRGDDTGNTLQTGAISLLSALLELPALGVSFQLDEYRDLISETDRQDP